MLGIAIDGITDGLDGKLDCKFEFPIPIGAIDKLGDGEGKSIPLEGTFNPEDGC